MSDDIDPRIQTIYKPIKKIGSGAYGIVWKAQNRKTKALCALKKSFDAFSNSTDAQRTYREIMFLRQLNHPNIVKLQGVHRAENDRDIYLVFEHMDIDLHTLIRENDNNQHLQERHKQYIIYQIAKALFFLHNNDIIHRDIKPSNVLVNESCEAKLCDFGLVRSLQDATNNDQTVIFTEYIATRWYRAPELLLGAKRYSKEVDIWALGCMVGELIRGKPMFQGSSTTNQLEKILGWTGPPKQSQLHAMGLSVKAGIQQILYTKRRSARNQLFSSKVSSECLDFISRMLEFNPAQRLNIEEVLKHSYLKEFYSDAQFNAIKSQSIKLKLHVDDNVRLSLKNYRELIYNEMEQETQTIRIRQDRRETQVYIAEGKPSRTKTQPNYKETSKPSTAATLPDATTDVPHYSHHTYSVSQQQISTSSAQMGSNGLMYSGTTHPAYTAGGGVKKMTEPSESPYRQKSIGTRKKGISLCSKQDQTKLTGGDSYCRLRPPTRSLRQKGTTSKDQRDDRKGSVGTVGKTRRLNYCATLF